MIPNEICFNGNPEIAKALFKIDFEKKFNYRSDTFSKYILGDPEVNMYFGFEPKVSPSNSKNLISKKILDHIEDHIMPLNSE